jgi:guanine deaminase
MVLRRISGAGNLSGQQTGLTIFVGRIVHSLSLQHLEIIPHGIIGVSPEGSIAFVIHNYTLEDALCRVEDEYGNLGANVVVLSESQFLFPGMIDTHLHAPQWPNLALGMEGDLRQWVEEWTDPIEVR